MKTIVVKLVCFLMPLLSFAQDADAFLDDVYNKVTSYENIHIDFKYALRNVEQGVSQETRGDVTLQGQKFVLNLLGVTQLYDGNKLHVIIPEDEEINISKFNEEGMSPSELLTFYKKGFKAEMDIVQNISGRKIQYVKLTPTTKTAEYSHILLGVDQESKHIYRQIIIQNDGTEITITVNKFKPNQPLSDTLFTFDMAKYSDYYINELD